MIARRIFALATIAGLTACNIAREGSVLVIDANHSRTNSAAAITAAANGANAQTAGNHSEMQARGQASLTLSRNVWTWILVGVILIVAAWLLWKFVFTGARIALVGG